MRAHRVALPLLLLLVAAPLAAADTTLRVVAHNEGAPGSRNEHPYWFTIEGLEGRDPLLRLTPGDTVHVTFTNAGDRAHQLQFGAPIDVGTALVEPNATVLLSFRVPTDATGDATGYWCALHRPIGMAGALAIGQGAASKAPLSESTRPDLLPAPTFPLALLAILVAWRWRR